jgi:hypothetical protein
MPEFRTADLGQIMQTAEALKGMKRQGETDRLRDMYLGVQTENARQAGQIDASQEERAKSEQAAQVQAREARQHYLIAQNIKTLPPERRIPFIQQFAPEFIENYEKKHGPGTFVQQSPQEIEMGASEMMAHFGSMIGVGPGGGTPEQQFELQAQTASDDKRFSREKELARIRASNTDTSVNQQLITRPVGDGTVQDFAWNPRTNQREPAGAPYRPVTPHTGNVTEGERKAAALGTRLELAMQALNEIEQTAPGASSPGLMERGLEGMGAETLANAFRSSDRQQADAAQLDALDAALTLATGAAYTKEQLANLRKSYFPQIGDSAENIKAKQKRFQTIVETARIAAGRAEPSIDKAVAGSQQQTQQQPVQVGSDEQYAALPSGTQYIAPDGSTRVKR